MTPRTHTLRSIVALAIALPLAALAVVGCGGSSSQETDTTTAPKARPAAVQARAA